MDEIFDFSVLETMPDADAEIVVPDEVLEGPQTEEEGHFYSLVFTTNVMAFFSASFSISSFSSRL